MAIILPAFVCGTRKYDADFITAYSADVGDWHDSGIGTRRCGAELPSPGSEYRIYRVHVRFNIPSGAISYAFLQSQDVYSSHGVTIEMYDATSIGGFCADADYGEILDLPSLLGYASFPGGVTGQYYWRAYFNATGIAFLNSKQGGSASIAFRSSYQPASSGDRGFVGLYTSGFGLTKLYIGQGDSYKWVEGTNFAYTDTLGAKRTMEGTVTGDTGAVAGEDSVEGDYLHYIDASLDERRILGTATGLGSKVAGQISVNTVQGGTKFCYIDSSGNERCFEGST